MFCINNRKRKQDTGPQLIKLAAEWELGMFSKIADKMELLYLEGNFATCNGLGDQKTIADNDFLDLMITCRI